MVNLRFNFKMDLTDISTIDFAFADSYAELETDPFLTKSFPEDGEHSQRSIILTLSAEEAELLPEQFYALATVNFKNGETIKAHAFKNTAKEEALSAALALEDTEFNINFFIDEVAGGGGNGTNISVEAGGHLDLSNGVLSTEATKIYEAVFDGEYISDIRSDYPNLKAHDIAIDYTNGVLYSQGYLPPEYEEYVSWRPINFNTNSIVTSPIKIYEAKFNNSNNFISNASNYPNIKKGDFMTFDSPTGRKYIRMVNGVASNNNINFTSFIDYLQRTSISKLLTAPPTDTTPGPETAYYDVGQIVETLDGYFQCTSKETQGERPVHTIYTWQEVTFMPKPTSNDAGKVLQVNSNGLPEWVTP